MKQSFKNQLGSDLKQKQGRVNFSQIRLSQITLKIKQNSAVKFPSKEARDMLVASETHDLKFSGFENNNNGKGDFFNFVLSNGIKQMARIMSPTMNI
jgi:hypothetical protein